ncbi:MAG: HesA/MoeB/ThiF family protein [Pelotomaculum sp.]|uniref:Dinucleotide-utilizing enzymes n=1 Tax=Pelotomaculum thermopropionicum (strain DSM 13744 / JCM 10971 / SI) TaxID=370438 RepID=A5D501_PELTS|nr:HesA/MoeB/ThiF family protein [Pelotomaculum sp.]BAF58679.1 dinucleotide-utilizing enzymes [Pelotomaculum thermopropionicum SI]
MKDALSSLSGEQRVRYERNILLPGVGVEGQKRLLQSGVLIVGAGGLGSPAAYYLAAAGVGRLGLADADAVGLSNLQRQILHRTGDIGRPKAESARDKLAALNPDVRIEIVREYLNPDNAEALVGRYDIVVDCTDNFPSRFILNKVCVLQRKPFVYGGVLAFTGQAMTVVPGAGPCFRCLYPSEPAPGGPTCSELGVLGAVPGVIGAIQAAEAVKYLLGLGDLLVGRLLVYDAASMTFSEVSLKRSPRCPDCSGL